MTNKEYLEDISYAVAELDALCSEIERSLLGGHLGARGRVDMASLYSSISNSRDLANRVKAAVEQRLRAGDLQLDEVMTRLQLGQLQRSHVEHTVSTARSYIQQKAGTAGERR